MENVLGTISDERYPSDRETEYRNIMEWLYTEEAKYIDKDQWRKELLKVLRFNILHK